MTHETRIRTDPDILHNKFRNPSPLKYFCIHYTVFHSKFALEYRYRTQRLAVRTKLPVPYWQPLFSLMK
jgi:hypothetical protein